MASLAGGLPDVDDPVNAPSPSARRTTCTTTTTHDAAPVDNDRPAGVHHHVGGAADVDLEHRPGVDHDVVGAAVDDDHGAADHDDRASDHDLVVDHHLHGAPYDGAADDLGGDDLVDGAVDHDGAFDNDQAAHYNDQLAAVYNDPVQPADVDGLHARYRATVEHLDHAYSLYRQAARDHDNARAAWVAADRARAPRH